MGFNWAREEGDLLAGLSCARNLWISSLISSFRYLRHGAWDLPKPVIPDTICPAQGPPCQSLSSTLSFCPKPLYFVLLKAPLSVRTVLGHTSCFISKARAREYSHPLTVRQWLTDVRLHQPGSSASKVRRNPAVWFMFQSSPQDHAEVETSSEMTPVFGFFFFRVLSPPTSPNSWKHFGNKSPARESSSQVLLLGGVNQDN